MTVSARWTIPVTANGALIVDDELLDEQAGDRMVKVVPADQYDRERAAASEVVADLCALAEEQPGNPHDDLSTRLYEIAHKIELAQVEPVHA